MVNLKIENLLSASDSLIEKNIVVCSNNIKDYYGQSNLYQKALLSGKTELLNLSKEIQSDLNSLSINLNQFHTYFKNYINDYIFVQQYLTQGSQCDVTSIPTSNLLKSSLSLKQDKLKTINIINLKLVMDYEKIFQEKDNKSNE